MAADFEKEREHFEAIYPRPAHCDWIPQSARFCMTSYNGWDAMEHCNKWLGWKARAESADGVETCDEPQQGKTK